MKKSYSPKNSYLNRVMTLIFVGLAALAVLLVLFVNRTLADLAEWIYPGSAFVAHMVLMGVEALAFLWFWLGVFGGKKHLLLMEDPTPEAEERFAAEFMRRMQTNPHILRLKAEAAANPALPAPPDANDPAYRDWCIARLTDKANAEIRQNASRVFLATSLSQNGKLDALLVFVALCRLVWRISSVYNQRPHPREVMSLYWAVVTSTFLALSVEELDIATEISVGFGEAFHAIAPLGLTTSLPVAGRAMQRVTTSTVEGAVNCYLCLRAGIITRNAFAYRAKQQAVPSRTAVFKEAGVILLDMSAGLVEKLARALAGALKNSTVRVSKDIAGGISQGVSASAGLIASGAVSAVQGTGNGISKAAEFIASPFRSKNGGSETHAAPPPADDFAEDPAKAVLEALETYLRAETGPGSGEAPASIPTREHAEKRMDKAYAELLDIVENYNTGKKLPRSS